MELFTKLLINNLYICTMQQSNTLVIVLLVVVILAVAYFMFMRPQTPTIVQTSPTGTGGEISNTTLWATSIMNLLGGIGNSIAAGFNASSAGQGGTQNPPVQQ